MEKLKLGVSYFGNRIPWRVREDLKAIQDAGCTYVVHTFSEEDLEYYQPAMEEIVGMSREMGLEVWLDPWAVGQAFGGETYSRLVMKELSLRQVSSQGELLPIICLNQPGFRDYLQKWIETAARLKPDGLFWDEPHFHIYPEPDASTETRLWACRCPVCREGFRRRFSADLPDRLTAQVRQYKQESIVEFTRFLCDETKAKGLQASLCVLPLENSSTVSDWDPMAAIPSVDSFGTDPYWKPHEPQVDRTVGRFAKKTVELARKHGKEPHLWILNFNIPRGEEGKIRQAIEAGWAEGIRNFAAWSYYGSAYINYRAQDPAAVWHTLRDSYKELHGRILR